MRILTTILTSRDIEKFEKQKFITKYDYCVYFR